MKHCSSKGLVLPQRSSWNIIFKENSDIFFLKKKKRKKKTRDRYLKTHELACSRPLVWCTVGEVQMTAVVK